MQIEVAMSSHDGKSLPFSYNHEFASALYTVLTEFYPPLASDLHDGSRKSRIKLFAVSCLNSTPHPAVTVAANGEHMLNMGEKIWFRFSSIVPEILYSMSDALLRKRVIRVRCKEFEIRKVDMVRPPVFEERMVYRPFGQAGTILCKYQKDGRTYFQLPDNREKSIPSCAELLCGNLTHKLMVLKQIRPDIHENLLTCSGLTEKDIDHLSLSLEFLPLKEDMSFKESVCHIRRNPLRSFRAPFILTAPEAIHRIAWTCGVGSLNSQCFGFITEGKKGDSNALKTN